MNIHPKGPPPSGPRDDPSAGAPEPARRERYRADHALAEEAQEAGGDGEFRLSSVLQTLWAYKWPLAVMTLLGMGLAWLYVSTETPLYTASARVVLEARQERMVDFESVVPQLSTDWTAMNTEILNLRSKTLMVQVVDALDLTADPEFNPHLREPPEWKETTGYNDLMAALGRVPEPRPAPTPARARATAAAILGGKVRVSIVPNTYAFEVAVETQAPRKSAEIANTITETYIENQRQTKFQAANDASQWLGQRAVELKAELEAAEKDVKEFSADARAVNEETVARNSQRLKDMRARQAELRERATEFREQAARLEALRAEGDFEALAEAADAPELGQLVGELETGAATDADLARLDTLLERRVQGLRAQAADNESRAASFTSPISELAAEVEAQSSDLVTLRQLRREAEATRLVYEHFLARMKEVSVQEGIQRADARILEPATGGGLSYPNVRGTTARGGVAGFVLGLVLISIKTLLRNSLRSPEELEATTGITVIGVIPEWRIKRPENLISQLVEKPGSGMAEAVRNLRTAIQLSNVDTPPQVVMLTSSVPDEGKSVLAGSLAQISAMAGKRVLLIEGDLRHRQLREYFGLEPKAGLVGLLSGSASHDEAVLTDPSTKLDLILAEGSKVSPVDLFDSARFRTFLDEMRKSYDLVVIDTPPVLAVPDARVIAPQVDSIVYVVRWNATTRRMVQSGLDLFHQVNLRVTGLALTRIDPTKMDRYGYYGYGYGSGYGSRKMQKYYAH